MTVAAALLLETMPPLQACSACLELTARWLLLRFQCRAAAVAVRMVFTESGPTFMECTAMSIRPSSSASSISLVKRPLPPMSARGWPVILSPVVLITQIWRASSPWRFGKAACSHNFVVHNVDNCFLWIHEQTCQ